MSDQTTKQQATVTSIDEARAKREAETKQATGKYEMGPDGKLTQEGLRKMAEEDEYLLHLAHLGAYAMRDGFGRLLQTITTLAAQRIDYVASKIETEAAASSKLN